MPTGETGSFMSPVETGLDVLDEMSYKAVDIRASIGGRVKKSECSEAP